MRHGCVYHADAWVCIYIAMPVEPAADEDVQDEDMELQAMANEILETRVPKREAEDAVVPQPAKLAKKEHEFEEPAGPERQANKEMCVCSASLLLCMLQVRWVCLDLSMLCAGPCSIDSCGWDGGLARRRDAC